MAKKDKNVCVMTLLPPKAGTCPECAVTHDPSLPHDATSLYYQVKFSMTHGRNPTWKDASAHCAKEVRQAWMKALKEVEKEKDNE